jgi:hypothetical protein
VSHHIPDVTKMISDTPRMKAAQMAAIEHGTGDVWRVGCDIEHELNAANERIKRLVQAGDCLLSHRNSTDYHEKVREWDKAKKDKP